MNNKALNIFLTFPLFLLRIFPAPAPAKMAKGGESRLKWCFQVVDWKKKKRVKESNHKATTLTDLNFQPYLIPRRAKIIIKKFHLE